MAKPIRVRKIETYFQTFLLHFRDKKVVKSFFLFLFALGNGTVPEVSGLRAAGGGQRCASAAAGFSACRIPVV